MLAVENNTGRFDYYTKLKLMCITLVEDDTYSSGDATLDHFGTRFYINRNEETDVFYWYYF